MDLRAFAGGDQVSSADDAEVAGFIGWLNGEIAVPLVGAANATAVAGGLELLLGCDVIVASSEARVRPARGEAGAVRRRRRHVPRPAHPARRRPRADAHRRHASTPPGPTSSASSTRWCRPTRCSTPPSRSPSGSPPTARSASPPSKELVRLGATDPSRAAERLAELAAGRVRQRGRQGGRDGVRREAAARSGTGRLERLTCAPPSAATLRPARGRRVEDAPVARRSAPGQVRVARRAPRPSTSPTCCWSPTSTRSSVPPPFVPGSEFAGVVTEVADDVDRVARRRPRVRARRSSAPSPRRRSSAADALRRIPDGVDDRRAAAFGVAHRTAYHVLRSVAARAARRRAGRARRRRRRRPGGRAARRRARRLGDGGGVVGREARGAPATAARRTSSTTAPATCARRCGTRCPTAPTSSSTRSAATWPSRRCARCAGAAGSSPSATRRATIPRIPLNLVLLKGVQVLGFQFRRLRHPRARRVRPQRGRADRPARRRAASCRTSAPRSRSTTPPPPCATSPTAGPSARSSSMSPPPAGEPPHPLLLG